MITDKDARLLVTNLRGIAKENEDQARAASSETWRKHCEGRADAYRLAADWLEELIPNGEADGE